MNPWPQHRVFHILSIKSKTINVIHQKNKARTQNERLYRKMYRLSELCVCELDEILSDAHSIAFLFFSYHSDIRLRIAQDIKQTIMKVRVFVQ